MRYSTKPREWIYLKVYKFLPFAKNMGKRSSNRYSTKLLHSAKKSKTDAIKTASKRTIQKTAEGTDDLIRNKIAAKITIKAEKSHQQELDTLREIYTSQEKRQQIINDLRLI